jgi:excisionase family DNA binding protein
MHFGYFLGCRSPAIYQNDYNAKIITSVRAMNSLRPAQLKDDLQQCTASLIESADGLKNVIEEIYQILSRLLDASPQKVDAGQSEAKPVNESRRLLTAKEIAAYLGVSDRTIYLWVKQKNLPYRKVGEDLRFDLKEVEAWTAPETKTLEKAPLHMVE